MPFGAVISLSSGGSLAEDEAARQRLASALRPLVAPECLRWVSGNAQAQAQELVDCGVEGLIVGGGDGTVSSVAGLAAAACIPLGILPLGTRNHFARDLGIPGELAAAVEVVRAQRRRRVDLGELNGVAFINNVSVGMYPQLVLQRERYRRRHGLRKLPAHLAAAWYVFRRFPRSRVRVVMGDRALVLATPILFVANNPYRDGLMGDTHRPLLDSGRLWVCIARAHGQLELMRACWDFIVGRAEQVAGLETATAEAVTVAMRRHRVRVAVDGEVRWMRTPLRMRSLPGALEVLVP